MVIVNLVMGQDGYTTWNQLRNQYVELNLKNQILESENEQRYQDILIWKKAIQELNEGTYGGLWVHYSLRERFRWQFHDEWDLRMDSNVPCPP